MPLSTSAHAFYQWGSVKTCYRYHKRCPWRVKQELKKIESLCPHTLLTELAMAATIAPPAALSVLGMGGRVSCSSSTSSSKLAAKLGRWKGTRAAAIDGAAADPEVTWQIVVGALGMLSFPQLRPKMNALLPSNLPFSRCHFCLNLMFVFGFFLFQCLHAFVQKIITYKKFSSLNHR